MTAADDRAALVDRAKEQWKRWRAEADRSGSPDRRDGWECVADFVLSEIASLSIPDAAAIPSNASTAPGVIADLVEHVTGRQRWTGHLSDAATLIGAHFEKAKAQARREAIEECARAVMSARVHQAWKLWKVPGVSENELARADCFDDAMRYEIRDAIRALADQPAARGEKEDEKPTDVGTPVVAYATASTEAASVGSLRPGLLRAAEMARAESGLWSQPAYRSLRDFADALAAEAAKHAETTLDDADELRAIAEMHRPVGPVLSDAEVLERAAAIYADGWPDDDGGLVSRQLRAAAKILRQPPAPEPDVFVAFANASFRSDNYASDDAREWFGPLVEALESVHERLGDYHFPPEKMREDIAAALAQLRARAKEAK